MSCEQIGTILRTDGTEVSYDGLPQTSFNILIPKASNTVLFLQSFDMPEAAMSSVSQPTPYLDLSNIGEKMLYPPFNCTFLIDSKFRNYREIYEWMLSITATGNLTGQTDNALLTINNTVNIRFNDCWPMSLSSVHFVTNATDMQYLTANVTMNYDYWEFV